MSLVVAKEKKLKATTEEWELPYSGLDGRCIEKSIGEYRYKICASLGLWGLGFQGFVWSYSCRAHAWSMFTCFDTCITTSSA